MMNPVGSIRRLARCCRRALSYVARRTGGWMLRRAAARLARSMEPLEETIRRLGDLEPRVEKLEGVRWDQVAYARRLAALEDHVERLLEPQRQAREASTVPIAVPLSYCDRQAGTSAAPISGLERAG